MKYLSRLVLSLVLTALTSIAFAQTSQWEITRLGFTDSDHTKSDGYQFSEALAINAQGQVIGYSERYGGSGYKGTSGWFYDGSNLVQLGLTGSTFGYIRYDGRSEVNAGFLNDAGQVAGTSTRYYSFYYPGSLGTAAWLYDGGNTIELGLTGSDYTDSNGFETSSVSALNNLGQVAGTTNRLAGGQATWIYNGASTLRVGLTGAEFTKTLSSGDAQYSAVQAMNELGHIIGYSSRYSGTTDVGKAAWLYDGSNTVRLGLTGSDYIRSNDGFQSSEAQYINDQGVVVGKSVRYASNGANRGEAIWLYNSTSTVRLGLTGSDYTRVDGYQNSYASALNEQGQVIGHSDIFSGGSNYGRTAWFYDGSNITSLGLSGSDYSTWNGNAISTASTLNNLGHVTGTSKRSLSAGLGEAAWFFDGNSTIQIGLTGANYTSSSGYQFSRPTLMNDQGQVVGLSKRSNGSASDLGQAAWFFDSETGQTFDLTLSERSDGYASSAVQYLGEDGTALGFYWLYDDNDNVSWRAFYFSMEQGVFDMTDRLLSSGEDLSAQGWDHLFDADLANELGQIVGQAVTNNSANGYGVYLISATTVPIPAAAWFFGSALIGLAGLKRRG